MRRPGLFALVLGAVLAAGQPALAQQPDQGVLQMPFVTLDDGRLFAESAYGKALLQELEREQLALAAENRELEADLARREQELTDLRQTLPPAEFRALADRFNTEVEGHRAAQQGKERAIYQRHDDARLRFRQIANQVLAEVMDERGALAILAEEAIVLGFRELDITQDAVARMDALIGDGSALPQPDRGGGGPAPEAAPSDDSPPPGDTAP